MHTLFPHSSGNVKAFTANNMQLHAEESLRIHSSLLLCVHVCAFVWGSTHSFLPPLVAWTPVLRGWPVFHTECQPATLPRDRILCSWMFLLCIHMFFELYFVQSAHVSCSLLFLNFWACLCMCQSRSGCWLLCVETLSNILRQHTDRGSGTERDRHQGQTGPGGRW